MIPLFDSISRFCLPRVPIIVLVIISSAAGIGSMVHSIYRFSLSTTCTINDDEVRRDSQVRNVIQFEKIIEYLLDISRNGSAITVFL